MPDLIQLTKDFADSRAPDILVAAGILFFLLGFADVKEIIVPKEDKPKFRVFGVIFMVLGFLLYIPRGATPPSAAENPTKSLPLPTAASTPTRINTLTPIPTATSTFPTPTLLSATPTLTLSLVAIPTIDPVSRMLVINQVNGFLESKKWRSAIQTIITYQSTYQIYTLSNADPELAKLKDIALMNNGDALVTAAMATQPVDVNLLENARQAYLDAGSLDQDNKNEAETKAEIAWLWISGNNSWQNQFEALSFFRQIKQKDKWNLFSRVDGVISFIEQGQRTPEK